MNEEKRKKAEILLDAIGEIDEAMLDEALEYRKKPRVNVKIISIAASIALIFALVASSELVKRITDIMGENKGESPTVTDTPNDGENTPNDENRPSDSEVELTLDRVFENLSNKDEYASVTDPDTLPYLDGRVYIVWQYEGVERYYISEPLSDGEFNTIKDALGKGRLTGNESPTLSTRVWVLLGDGRVISPYLEASPGNVSSEIFDYEVEIIPNKAFADKLQGILG